MVTARQHRTELLNYARNIRLNVESEIYIAAVNDLARRFVYTTDKEQYGAVEEWRVPDTQPDGSVHDDCDGFVTKLRHDLWEDHGLIVDVIFCMIPTREGYGGHAVAYFNGYLADCNHRTVFNRHDVTNWVWVKQSSGRDLSRGWTTIA